MHARRRFHVGPTLGTGIFRPPRGLPDGGKRRRGILPEPPHHWVIPVRVGFVAGRLLYPHHGQAEERKGQLARPLTEIAHRPFQAPALGERLERRPPRRIGAGVAHAQARLVNEHDPLLHGEVGPAERVGSAIIPTLCRV